MTTQPIDHGQLVDQLADVLADAVCQRGKPTRDIASAALAWLDERGLLIRRIAAAEVATVADSQLRLLLAATYGLLDDAEKALDIQAAEVARLSALVAAADEFGDPGRCEDPEAGDLVERTGGTLSRRNCGNSTNAKTWRRGNVQEIDTTNRQLVGRRVGDGSITIRLPKVRMSRTEALVHAAWIVMLADASTDEFTNVLSAVKTETYIGEATEATQ